MSLGAHSHIGADAPSRCQVVIAFRLFLRKNATALGRVRKYAQMPYATTATENVGHRPGHRAPASFSTRSRAMSIGEPHKYSLRAQSSPLRRPKPRASATMPSKIAPMADTMPALASFSINRKAAIARTTDRSTPKNASQARIVTLVGRSFVKLVLGVE